jgi:integrase
MRGHVTERRPGVWRLTVSAGFDDAGRRQRVTRTVRGTKRDAERALTVLLKDKDDKKLAGGRQRLDHYLREEWLPSVSKVSKRGRPLAPTTRERYASACEHAARIVGSVRLLDLEVSHIERLRDRLTSEGRLAPQTVADVLRVVSQALARAEAKGLVGRNPASALMVHRPTGERHEFTVIDARMGGTILSAVLGLDPWDAAVHLALGLGLRREEVLGLRWSDVDDAVHVRQTLTAAAGKLHFGPPKSAAGRRDLPLPGFVAAALQRHKVAQAERLLVAGIRSELVVDNGVGEPRLPASFSKGWERFATAQKFDGITFHGLRHGAATLLLAAGVPDAVAASVMGHADTRILARYQDVVAELRQDAAARMDALFAP